MPENLYIFKFGKKLSTRLVGVLFLFCLLVGLFIPLLDLMACYDFGSLVAHYF